METPEKCKKLVDALAEGGRGFPTLEVTETLVWPDEFDANEVANDGKKEVELLTSKAEAVSIKLASVLYPDRVYVDRNETLANHLHEDISRIRQIIDSINYYTRSGLKPDQRDLPLLAKYAAAKQEQRWLGFAMDACTALTYLYYNMVEADAADILQKRSTTEYSCTVEILQRFYKYCWICLARGAGNWSGTWQPGRDLCPPGNEFEDIVSRSDHINRFENELDGIQTEWERGTSLGGIMGRLERGPID